MKYLFLLLVSIPAFSICLLPEVGEKLSQCEPMRSSRAKNWCARNFGKEYQAYRTTPSCSLDLQSKYQEGWFEEVRVENFINVESRWTDEYNKKLKLECSGEKAFVCTETCGNEKSCELVEGFCKNCVGTSIKIVNFFKSIGISLLAANSTPGYALAELLKSGNYASFTSKSIYNLLTRYNAKNIKSQFQSLCEDETEYPMVVAELDQQTREILDFRYVVCRSGISELENNFLVN